MQVSLYLHQMAMMKRRLGREQHQPDLEGSPPLDYSLLSRRIRDLSSS